MCSSTSSAQIRPGATAELKVSGLEFANALLVVDPESGEWSTAYYPQTAAHQQLLAEWQRSTESGEPQLELFGPDMWSPLPGLLTGLILTSEGGPVYLTGLGDTLVKLETGQD